MERTTFYITTPIYYVNDVPHIGHAYTTVAADVLARYWRTQLGAGNVHFLTGTDEHGAKVAQSAEKVHMSPKEFTDLKSAAFQEAWDTLAISNNDFIRTTEQRHKQVVHELLVKLKEAKTPAGNDFLYQGAYEGLYCVGCESYKTEDDLVDGKCPDHGVVPQLLKEENWFMRLSDYAEVLREKIESQDILIRPKSKHKEVLGLLNQGLQDIAISRAHVSWGITLPFSPEQTVYVWIEALINYISALGGPDGANFQKFWPADVHLMAKDIIKFHALIWPAMLLALGIEPPKQIFAHGFFTIDGKKMSKTLGNVISPNALAEVYGCDATRYLLLSQFGFGTDGDFSQTRLTEQYNAALANEFGNLVNRALSMTDKYFAGVVPEYNVDYDKFFEFDLKTDWGKYDYHMRELEFEDALKVVWGNIRRCNSYIDEQKPWELATTDRDVLADVLYNVLETLRHTAIMLLPFMPDKSTELLTQLGFEAAQELETPLDDLRSWSRLPLGQKIQKAAPLFPRIESQEA